MENLIQELRVSLKNGLYIMALNTALIVPDICSALESEDGQTNGKRYKAWFDKYVTPKYEGFASGDDIYKIRCATLHQGKFNHDYPKYQKILFQIPNKQNNIFHCNILNDALNLNVEIFVSDIIEGYEKWKKDNKGNQTVEENVENSISFYPNGLAPYMVGIPILA